MRARFQMIRRERPVSGEVRVKHHGGRGEMEVVDQVAFP